LQWEPILVFTRDPGGGMFADVTIARRTRR